jgi:glycosyltransferase involved in cell wall biosynthesis
MTEYRFNGTVALQQRVFPSYRLAFFRLLTQSFKEFSLFAGNPREDEVILSAEEAHGINLTRARNIHLSRGKSYICLQTNLKDWLTAQDPDVLILEANPRYLSNRVAMRWMRERSRPVLGWGLGAPSALPALMRNLRNRYLRRFDAMISYSSSGAEQYMRAGLPEDRVFIATNAVAAAPARIPARVSYGGPMRVLFVGRLQTRKRVDLLLRACANLEPKPELTIVGDGPARDELVSLALRILPAVHFTGALQGKELRKQFEHADLFVLPGTGGLAAQEAMAHGLPIIIAEGDGTQQDLVTEKNGWLVAPGDLDALTATLAEANSRSQELGDMGIESHRIVKDRVNISVMAASFTDAVRAVTGS